MLDSYVHVWNVWWWRHHHEGKDLLTLLGKLCSAKKCRVTMLCEDEKKTSLLAGMKTCRCTKHIKFTAISKNSHHCNFFFGPRLKNLHFVLAKCLEWRRNHDPYSTKTTSNSICSKWKCEKIGYFQWWDREKHDEDVQRPGPLTGAATLLLFWAFAYGHIAWVLSTLYIRCQGSRGRDRDLSLHCPLHWLASSCVENNHIADWKDALADPWMGRYCPFSSGSGAVILHCKWSPGRAH